MTDAPLVNGALLITGHTTPDTPAVDSPDTPIDNSPSADIKIDVEYNDGESDARHEPVPVKVDLVDSASVRPQVGTPADPATIPIEPPKGTPPPPPGELLEDVQMAESLPTKDSDVHMADADAQPPSSTEPVLVNGHNHESPAPPTPTLPAVPSSQTAVDALAAPSLTNNTTNEHDDDDKPPPAKRARKYSDAERASLANTGTPPPASPSDQESALPAASSSRPTPTLSLAQWRFCTSTIRTLKKLKDAGPFLQPVDPVALNIPHYPSIVKHPMDFSTIDRKMASSNPAKPDPNASNPRYNNADEFIVDVRLIFHNCILFNGPDHPITAMGKRVEAVFEKQIKQMPPPGEPKPQVVKKAATPPPPPPPPAKKPAARRPSTSVPVIRRSEDHINGGGRPKREIHPPPPKDLPYTDAPKKMRKAKAPKNNAYVDQFKFCEKILRDVHKKSYYTIAHPFYEPVDWVKLDIPQYPKIIKKPMDLSTMRRKLQDGEYSTPEKFREDFKLMVKNSLMFNPPKNPVHEAGKELDRIFDEKWKQLPPLRSQDMSDDDDDDEDDDTDDERSRMIANIESQIQHMRNNLDTLKRKAKPEKKEKKKKEKVVGPVASTSKAPKPMATKSIPPRKKGKKPITDDDVLTFEQKKELSDTIGKLDGVKLERVIQIIHEGVPEIRDSTEEIELEIDQLPASVLQKLYNFVIRPMKASVPKRARTGKGTGTGGLKRKSMDEDVEAAKIRALEERMKLFEGGRESAGPANEVPAHDDSEHSSNESSSESSGSDSE